MIQLGADEAHINNAFGSQNVVEIMGMSGVQYSRSYGFLCTRSTHTPLADNNMDVEFSVSHSDQHYSE